MVLKFDVTARCLWKIAKVTKLIESKDGKIRAAEIQVLGSNEKRGIIILRSRCTYLYRLRFQRRSLRIKKVSNHRQRNRD